MKILLINFIVSFLSFLQNSTHERRIELSEVIYHYDYQHDFGLDKPRAISKINVVFNLYSDTTYFNKYFMIEEDYYKYFKYDKISLIHGYDINHIEYRLLTKKGDTLGYKDLIDKPMAVHRVSDGKFFKGKRKISKNEEEKVMYQIELPYEWQIYNSNLKEGDDNPIEYILVEIYKMEDHWLEKEVYNKTLIKTFKIPFTH